MICPHCGGSVIRSRELDGFEVRCLSCSRKSDEPFRQTEPPKFVCSATFCKVRCATEEELALHVRMNHQNVGHDPHKASAADKRAHHGILSAPANNKLYHEEFQR